MKTANYVVTTLAACIALSITGCFHNDNNSRSGGSASFSYPTQQDANDLVGGNDDSASATALAIGLLTSTYTIFPQGDEDYYAVNLTAGTDYEFSANKLCATCDVYMFLYDTDGVTQLAENDDYVGYDSAIQFTPSVDGTYYVKVQGYDSTYGIATYDMRAALLVDDDADGWSDYHDCDDTDANIKPGGNEIQGDGIDQSCTGYDVPLDNTVDIHEDDDTFGTAVAMVMAEGTPWERIYRDELYAPSGNLRTIDSAGEEDWMSIPLPAMSAIEISVEDDNFGLVSDGFESDGTTPSSSSNVENTTGSDTTHFMRYTGTLGTDTGWYVPYYYSLGTDMDADGYYTMDWDSARDCDDGDANINPGATETASDGIDSDCDGSD